jgi:hypothetical protein
MDLKIHPIDIDPAQPFFGDLLNRKDEVDNLTLIVNNLNSPAVIAVNSGWGTGKTTFIKMWAANLKLQGTASLYFNAWNTDFAANPLVAFLGEMNKGLQDLIGRNPIANKAWSQAKKFGMQIAKRGLPALIKIGTAGVIDADKIVEDEVAKVLDGLAGDALKVYEDHKSAIKNFKESLEIIVHESSRNTPVVIFVDELDRCRPNYALDLLERIKHLFDVKGLIFVLAMDRTQLGHSIKAIYGNGLDADGYLRRFIDLDYTLRKPDIGNYITNICQVLGIDGFFKLRSQNSALSNDWQHLYETLELLAKAYKLSLRETEQLLTRINLVFCATKENQYIYPALLAFLIVVREKNREIYEEYILENGSAGSAITHLRSLIPYEERIKNFECALIEGFLLAGKRSRRTEKISELNKYKEVIDSENVSEEEKAYVKQVVAIANNPIEMGRTISIENLVQKIEMSGQFQFPGHDK